jgi:hypothetical protein
LYTPAGGGYKSNCIQEQIYAPFETACGRTALAFEYVQRMPDLPAGIGKALHLAVCWLVTPVEAEASAAAAAGGGAEAAGGSERGGTGGGASSSSAAPSSAGTPRSHEAAAAPPAAAACAAAAGGPRAPSPLAAREPGTAAALASGAASDAGPFAVLVPAPRGPGSTESAEGASPRTPAAPAASHARSPLKRWSQGLLPRSAAARRQQYDDGAAAAAALTAGALAPEAASPSSWSSMLRLSASVPQLSPNSAGGCSPLLRSSPSWPRRRLGGAHANGGEEQPQPPGSQAASSRASEDGRVAGSASSGSMQGAPAAAGDAQLLQLDGLPTAFGSPAAVAVASAGDQPSPRLPGAFSPPTLEQLQLPEPLSSSLGGLGPKRPSAALSSMHSAPAEQGAFAAPAAPGPDAGGDITAHAPPQRYRWRIYVAVRFDRFHVAKSSIESGTYAATNPTLAALAATGTRWVTDPAARLSLAQALPSAALAIAPRHRRVGSHGSSGSGALKILGAGGHRRTGSFGSGIGGGGGNLSLARMSSLVARAPGAGGGNSSAAEEPAGGGAGSGSGTWGTALLAPWRAGRAAAARRLERLAAPAAAHSLLILLLLAVAAAQAVALWRVSRQLDALAAATAAAQAQQAEAARALLRAVAALQQGGGGGGSEGVCAGPGAAAASSAASSLGFVG